MPAPGSTLRGGWLVPVVFGAFVVAVVLHNVRAGASAAVLVLTAAFAVASMAVQLGCVRIGMRARLAYLVLAVQAVLVYLPVFFLGAYWSSIVAFVGGTALLLLRPTAGWLVFGAVVASVPVIDTAHGVARLEIVNSTGAAVITGLVVYGLTWLSRADRELRAVRLELARAAVARERSRFARDLHDLLGMSLSAIALKAELALRMIPLEPARAVRELDEIADLARASLTDVEQVAGGYGELSLGAEVRTAESVLAAADVDLRLELRYGELPQRVRSVLATVLREGVTNVLRHGARGATCEISVRQAGAAVTMEIVNTAAATGSADGCGLRNLTARVTEVGGGLTAGPMADGRFRLSARIPA